MHKTLSSKEAQERKLWLLGEKERLEYMISITKDPKAQNDIRGDYRKVIDEMGTYYDDIPLERKKRK